MIRIIENQARNDQIDGFHGDVIKLSDQNSEVFRIFIYTRLKKNEK